MTKTQDTGGVIQYIDGYAYGITKEGKTLCLGEETKVKAVLSDPRRKLNNPAAQQVLELERDLMKQLDKQMKKERAKERADKEERKRRAVEFGVARKEGKVRKNKNRA